MKKKFKETKVGKILLGGLSLISPELSNALGNITSLKSGMTLIKESSLSQENKRIYEKMLIDADKNEQWNVTQRWKADSLSDSWLSKNIRPMTLIFFSVIYSIGWFLNYDTANIQAIMLVIIGGYFGARSVEKVMNKKYQER